MDNNQNRDCVLEKGRIQETAVNLCASGDSFLMDFTIQGLAKKFLEWIQYEKRYSIETVQKYGDCLRCFVKSAGNIDVRMFSNDHIIQLKKTLLHRNVGDNRIASVIFALKSFLKYCNEALRIKCLESSQIKSPKRPKREVIYLTNEEVQKFVDAIKVYNRWRGKCRKRNLNIQGLRFRTLVEVLLATGMRISEALSLNTDDVDFKTGEATIIGKGNKQRSIFFNERALWWIKRYLSMRSDRHEALFVTHPVADRLKRTDIWRFFKRYAHTSGIKKNVTPHILRHTMATNMLYHGSDLFTIKEILGHHDISVTARSYIGVDKRKIKENYSKYLSYRVT